CPNSPSPNLAIQPIGANENCGQFGHTATGVQATNNAVSPPQVLSPAFCYLITVTNCGATDLTNVTVIDTVYGDLTADFFPSGPHFLAPGQGVSFKFKVTIPDPLDNEIYRLTNVVTGTGLYVTNTATGQGITTNASASAIAVVVPAGVVCKK